MPQCSSLCAAIDSRCDLPATPLSESRCILIGDAAGLIDPLSGEGIHSAFLSAKLGFERSPRCWTPDLTSYPKATLLALGGVAAESWGGKETFDRFPEGATICAARRSRGAR